MPTLIETVASPQKSRLPEPREDLRHAGEQLIAQLAAMGECYTVLVGLVEKQRKALIHNRMENLDAINSDIELAYAELEKIEMDRYNLVQNLSKICNHPTKSNANRLWSPDLEEDEIPVKLEELLPYFPVAITQGLELQRSRLKAQLPLLKRELSINAALAENGSRIVHATLSMLTSVVGREGPDRHQVYNARGAVQFGRQQVRCLLNRKI
jgi:hypothetical protein